MNVSKTLLSLFLFATFNHISANLLQPEAATNQPLVNEQNKKQPISPKLEPQKIESSVVQELKTALASLESRGTGDLFFVALVNLVKDTFIFSLMGIACQVGITKMRGEEISADQVSMGTLIGTTLLFLKNYYVNASLNNELAKEMAKKIIFASELEKFMTRLQESQQQGEVNAKKLVKILERAQLSPEDRKELEKIFPKLTAQQSTNQ